MLEGMKRKDINQTAFSIVQQATGEVEKPPVKPDGRRAGGYARMMALTPEGKTKLAKAAVDAKKRKKQSLASGALAVKKTRISV
jgi:hypothetical protein